ncbi:MAG: type IV secretion system DNA-binding domain-containing protein, partial [Bacteroidota bacterium]
FGYFLNLISEYDFLYHLLLYILPSLVLIFIITPFLPSPKKRVDKIRNTTIDEHFTIYYKTDHGKIPINLKRGVFIAGSAGAGKTDSAFLPIIDHALNLPLTSLYYDYKDFELTRKILALKTDKTLPIYTVAPSDVRYSHRCNPLQPGQINDRNDLLSLIQVLVDNFSTSKGENIFFSQAAGGALAGTAWRLLEEEQLNPYSSLPMAAMIVHAKPLEELEQFIRGNATSSILASEFLDSFINDRQMAPVKATLSAITKQICDPTISYLFSGNDFNLDLNNPEDPKNLICVNHPKYRSVLSPLLAMVMQCAINQMSYQGKYPSLLCFDEGSTVKLHDFHLAPATLRSYNIATVFGLQDKVQGELIYDIREIKALLANLSSYLFGKVNDPDTSKFYQTYFELIKEEQISISKGSNWLDTSERVNVSERETTKHKAYEFNRLSPGEMFMFNEKGENMKAQLKQYKYEELELPLLNDVNRPTIDLEFKKIIQIAEQIS